MKPQWNLIVPLAALGLVSAIMHVYHVYDTAPRAEGLIWTATLVTWVAVVVAKKTAGPFLTLTLTGGLSGLLAAIIQQLYWEKFWLGVQNYDTLSVNVLDPVVRAIAVGSSVAAGLLWGMAAGAIAAALCRLLYPKKTLKL